MTKIIDTETRTLPLVAPDRNMLAAVDAFGVTSARGGGTG